MQYLELKSYKETVNQVMTLSKQKSNHEITKFDHVDLDEIVSRRDNSPLYQYLNSLDYETIKVVETIMYLGRDYSNNQKNEYEDNEESEYDEEDTIIPDNEEAPLENPIQVFNQFYDDLSATWTNKSAEVNQIYSKIPLYRYLKRGIFLLGL